MLDTGSIHEMDSSPQRIDAELLKLPFEERARLAEVLDASVRLDDAARSANGDRGVLAQILESQALALSASDRARLVESLVASLEMDPEIARAWDEEVRRRIDDLRAGRVQTVPADEVFKEIEALLR